MLIKDLHKYIDKKESVLHVGGHTGEECDWYDRMNFYQVIWFEPYQPAYKLLRSNIEKYPSQAAVNIGIHDTLKKATLHIASNRSQSSSILDLDLHKKYHPKVSYITDVEIELMRMDEFFPNYLGFPMEGFNFLNVDVQGVELNVIKSFGDSISQLDYIYSEVNEAHLYKDCPLVGEIDEYLNKYGFVRKVTLMTKYKWGDALYVKQ